MGENQVPFRNVTYLLSAELRINCLDILLSSAERSVKVNIKNFNLN